VAELRSRRLTPQSASCSGCLTSASSRSRDRRAGSPRDAIVQIQTNQGCQLGAVKVLPTKTPEPRRPRPRWCKSPAGTEGGKPRPDYGLPNLSP